MTPLCSWCDAPATTTNALPDGSDPCPACASCDKDLSPQRVEAPKDQEMADDLARYLILMAPTPVHADRVRDLMGWQY